VRKPGHRGRGLIASGCVAAAVIAAVTVSDAPVGARNTVSDVASGRHLTVVGATYQALATRSVRLLESTFYNGTGLWHMCVPGTCNTKNRDWGADALTNVLAFRWLTGHDPTVLPFMRTLVQTAHLWTPGERGSSDSVMWDAVADVRMYQVTGSKVALAKAEAALRWIGTVPGLATGACPVIDYQWPHGHRGRLKTIETESNYIKAALLLYQITGKPGYLLRAQQQYAHVRRYFFVPSARLYTAYLFDNGSACRDVPGQYFASVNGNMIWAGQALAAATGSSRYLSQAVATARAAAAHLSDGAGVFADLQADNDITGPLVEAMYSLATAGHQAFAASWLMTNASAAGADDNSLGEFGRFFDGPPPGSLATAWQISGGIAIMAAAAALHPGGRPAGPAFWAHATFVADGRSLHGQGLRIAFTGQAIAIMGTIGDICCTAGHARVFVDGVQTFNRTGIWQNMSSPSRRQPDQVLFAWRWKADGFHVITIRPAQYDPEEGGSFFRMTGYQVVG
jgi:hypothetical protein